MNRDDLLQMLRATIPRDKTLLEAFLVYQALHFEEDWESLIKNFMTRDGQERVLVPVETFEAEISAFVRASFLSGVSDLASYTQTFGQTGLAKLNQLNQEEKDLVIEVALYNLVTRFQLLDSDGAYHSISHLTLLDKGDSANLVNVFRVANNLSDRISRDIEQFLLTYEPEVEELQQVVIEETEVIREIAFREEGFYLIASLEEDLSQLDLRTGQTEHLPAYERLNLSQKFDILSYFDQTRNDLSKLPNLRRGDFDSEIEMTPVYEGDQLLTYLEADGSVYDLKRPLTAMEESILEEISQTILAENTDKLIRLGIDLVSLDSKQRGILLDATGRFRLKDEDLLLLSEYAHASVTQLALTTELLQMGLAHDKERFFLTSQLDLEALRTVASTFLQDTLRIDEAVAFEEDKLKDPDLNFREWREAMTQPKEEKIPAQILQENPLVQDLLKRYPLGSMVSYKGQDFEVLEIEDANLNGLIRIELQNGYTELIEQNPVLYLRTLDEITQALYVSHAEIEEVEEPVPERQTYPPLLVIKH